MPHIALHASPCRVDRFVPIKRFRILKKGSSVAEVSLKRRTFREVTICPRFSTKLGKKHQHGQHCPARNVQEERMSPSVTEWLHEIDTRGQTRGKRSAVKYTRMAIRGGPGMRAI